MKIQAGARFTDTKGRPAWMQTMERCVHFNGLIANVCKAGVAYDAVKDDSQTPYRYPCLTGAHGWAGCATTCDRASFPTEEEAKVQEAALEARFEKRSADIAAGICPTHQTPMTMRQVGRCVYAEPCGCRLYQGRLPTTGAAARAQEGVR